ncbi:hypothetical protein GCM10023194_21600 [Planotetraspora phitsanulokensis]|uniref:Secreted protein n=1 Tax=Planotetraspora phitsanulokensis TaxID=575192 RepID=A0A8J3U434_9ACTN|nr:hypothetical protein [Planotetraspora phitsanulokensis]GII38218.1 hypothetical protein Pph01_32210 [Planotetraspora phitsanulokensis]
MPKAHGLIAVLATTATLTSGAFVFGAVTASSAGASAGKLSSVPSQLLRHVADDDDDDDDDDNNLDSVHRNRNRNFNRNRDRQRQHGRLNQRERQHLLHDINVALTPSQTSDTTATTDQTSDAGPTTSSVSRP